jgi:hypothetical protein
MKFYQDRCVWWITKFGYFDHFLWDKPKLFPYPNGNFGDYEMVKKPIINAPLKLMNLHVKKSFKEDFDSFECQVV